MTRNLISTDRTDSTRRSRLDLARMTPHDELASTSFCLAEHGNTYVVYPVAVAIQTPMAKTPEIVHFSRSITQIPPDKMQSASVDGRRQHTRRHLAIDFSSRPLKHQLVRPVVDSANARRLVRLDFQGSDCRTLLQTTHRLFPCWCRNRDDNSRALPQTGVIGSDIREKGMLECSRTHSFV
jgi:hypothetical protein